MKSIENQIMHASDWTPDVDPTNWIVTEKFDGFFARWTGSRLLSREGVDFNAPEWFTEPLPRNLPLDCELWAGYGKRNTLNNCERWVGDRRWASGNPGIVVIPFDAPLLRGSFTVRRSVILERVAECETVRHAHIWTCSCIEGLIGALRAVKDTGGEGLIIRHPDALYTPGRVRTMLKVK